MVKQQKRILKVLCALWSIRSSWLRLLAANYQLSWNLVRPNRANVRIYLKKSCSHVFKLEDEQTLMVYGSCHRLWAKDSPIQIHGSVEKSCERIPGGFSQGTWNQRHSQ